MDLLLSSLSGTKVVDWVEQVTDGQYRKCVYLKLAVSCTEKGDHKMSISQLRIQDHELTKRQMVEDEYRTQLPDKELLQQKLQLLFEASQEE